MTPPPHDPHHDPHHATHHATHDNPPRLLVTAGPTHEPIDAVRFIGNRSSGRIGAAIAAAAADRGWPTTLLLGPAPIRPDRRDIEVVPFRSTADLSARLDERFPHCDVLIMAAAVADYRPRPDPDAIRTKRRRTDGPLVLELEPTPDLLAGLAARRRPDQLLVGFALEPRDTLEQAARRKLDAKSLDLIVANPLETMEADTIEARLISRPHLGLPPDAATDGAIPKPRFGDWLIQAIHTALARHRAERGGADHASA